MLELNKELLQHIGENPLLHWGVVIVCILIIIYGSRAFCRKIFVPLVRTLTRKTQSIWDDYLFNNKVLNDFCDLVPPIILTLFIPLVFSEKSMLRIFLLKICWIYIIVAAVKLICSILSSLYVLSNENERLKKHALQGVFQMLKLMVICIGIIIVISTLIDKDPMNILAGLGASAAVLMLVFKDTIMGLVAGIQLSANDMLRTGDWITIPKYGADGSVIEVTLTTIKVQNWDKTITTIPPYALVSDSFQNWRGMQESGGRRIKRSINIDMNSISFCSKEQIKMFSDNGWLHETINENGQLVNLSVFRNYLENYLHNHSRVNKNMIVMVRQMQPTAQGLPLELYFFSDGTDWINYEHLQSEIFEQVLAILPLFNLKVFQSPTGTDIRNFSNKATEFNL